MKIDKCPECGETDCAWKWYADREKEFSGKLRDDLQDDFDDMEPVLKAEVINIYFEQAEQIETAISLLKQYKTFYEKNTAQPHLGLDAFLHKLIAATPQKG